MACKMTRGSIVDIPNIKGKLRNSSHKSYGSLSVDCCKGSKDLCWWWILKERTKWLLPIGLSLFFSYMRTFTFPMASMTASMAYSGFLEVVEVFLPDWHCSGIKGVPSTFTARGGLGIMDRVRRKWLEWGHFWPIQRWLPVLEEIGCLWEKRRL
jgi:hypothetical protein